VNRVRKVVEDPADDRHVEWADAKLRKLEQVGHLETEAVLRQLAMSDEEPRLADPVFPDVEPEAVTRTGLLQPEQVRAAIARTIQDGATAQSLGIDGADKPQEVLATRVDAVVMLLADITRRQLRSQLDIDVPGSEPPHLRQQRLARRPHQFVLHQSAAISSSHSASIAADTAAWS
jgi:hypothetical protein